MKEIYGYDFSDFVELMEPFIEDNAIKHIYIEKLVKYERSKNFNVNVVLGDVSAYNKSFEITCGDVTVEELFLGMMNTILLDTNVDFGRKVLELKSVNEVDVCNDWEVLV